MKYRSDDMYMLSLFQLVIENNFDEWAGILGQFGEKLEPPFPSGRFQADHRFNV